MEMLAKYLSYSFQYSCNGVKMILEKKKKKKNVARLDFVHALGIDWMDDLM